MLALYAMALSIGILAGTNGPDLWAFISTALAWIAAIGLFRRNDIGRRAGIVLLIFSLAFHCFGLLMIVLGELGIADVEVVTRPSLANQVLIPFALGIVVLHIWMIETLHSKGVIGLMKAGSV